MLNNPVVGIILFLCFIALSSFYLVNDSVSCAVSNSDLDGVNGYYVGENGIYQKRGHPLTNVPDVFDLISMRRFGDSPAWIGMYNGGWQLIVGKQPVYKRPAVQDGTMPKVHSPPPSGWGTTVQGTNGNIIISHIEGRLDDAPTTHDPGLSNIQLMLYGQPITMFILGCICVYAYYIYANNIPSENVTFSYDKVVEQGEYWRIITASLAHMDLMHLGFNCMALYQMGTLEQVLYMSS
jgi:hypothetical protein